MMTKNHIPAKDLNKLKKLTFEIIIKMINAMKYKPLKNKAVDHSLNWKKIPTMHRIMRRILFLASRRCTKVFLNV